MRPETVVMIPPTRSDLTRARTDNAARYPGPPDASADIYHATGAAVECARIGAWLREIGEHALAFGAVESARLARQWAQDIENGTHWEGERDE